MSQSASSTPTKRILILSALDIWSMRGNAGAPSLFRTLTALSNRYTLTFITGHAQTPSGQDEKLNGVRVIRFGIPWLQSMFEPHHAFSNIGKIVFPIWWLIFQLWAYRLVSREIRRSDFDALYAYEILAVPVMARLARRHHIPFIVRFQGTVLAPLLSKPLSRVTHFHHYCAFRTRADMIIMTNDGTQGDRVLRSLRNTSPRQFFWMNGVDRYPDSPPSDITALKKRLGISERDIFILAISRLKRWKRIDRCIEAIMRLDDPRVHLAIIGDGPERASLEAFARRGCASPRIHIHFVGSMPHDALGAYYQAADIFISCYSLSNVGNPLLEAMRMTKPILTLDNGGTAQVITHEKTGLLAPEGDPAALCAMLKRLVNDAPLRRQLGEAAQIYADTHFDTWHQRMDREYAAITELLNQRP
ncbi:MAG: glycosyltransferase family 4 protein [Patescibacteria group bacterium]